MAIEYCVRCGKRVTGEGAKARLCAWCLAKNPASPPPGQAALPGAADSTRTGAILPRSPAIWIAIAVILAAAGAGAYVLARRTPVARGDLRARYDAIKADTLADTSFERTDANERTIAELRAIAPGDLVIDLDALRLDYRGRFEEAAAKACRAALLDADGLVSADKFDEALQRLDPVSKPFLATDGGRRLSARREEIARFSAAAKAIASTSWTLRYWQWTSPGNAVAPPPDWDALTRQPPAHTERAEKIALVWGFGRPGNLEADFFAAEASADIDLPPGEYVLCASADDGVRVWVDGKLAIDDWGPHADRPVSVTLPLVSGKHAFRVAYYEATLRAALTFTIQPRH